MKKEANKVAEEKNTKTKASTLKKALNKKKEIKENGNLPMEIVIGHPYFNEEHDKIYLPCELSKDLMEVRCIVYCIGDTTSSPFIINTSGFKMKNFTEGDFFKIDDDTWTDIKRITEMVNENNDVYDKFWLEFENVLKYTKCTFNPKEMKIEKIEEKTETPARVYSIICKAREAIKRGVVPTAEKYLEPEDIKAGHLYVDVHGCICYVCELCDSTSFKIDERWVRTIVYAFDNDDKWHFCCKYDNDGKPIISEAQFYSVVKNFLYEVKEGDKEWDMFFKALREKCVETKTFLNNKNCFERIKDDDEDVEDVVEDVVEDASNNLVSLPKFNFISSANKRCKDTSVKKVVEIENGKEVSHTTLTIDFGDIPIEYAKVFGEKIKAFLEII